MTLELPPTVATTLSKDALRDLASISREHAIAVGREVARRAQKRPERYRTIPAELVTAALRGDEHAALELVELKLSPETTYFGSVEEKQASSNA